MLCKCHWIVLYTVHVTAFSLGGPFFSAHGVCEDILDLLGSHDVIKHVTICQVISQDHQDNQDH